MNLKLFNKEGFVITKPRNIAYALTAVCLVGMGGVMFVQQTAIVSQLQQWRLIAEPERLTEVYFTDYATLPKILTAGSQHKVTFTVRNLEHRATTYHYRIIGASEPGADLNLGGGTFMLQHDRTHQASADIVVPAAESQLAIKVELYYQGVALHQSAPTMQTQSIDFSVAVKNTAKPQVTL